MKHTAAEVMRLMQAAGVAAGLVSRPEQLLDDPQLKHRNHFWYLNHSELGSYPHLGESFQLSQTPVAGRLPAPILGEHTEYVCTKIMNMPDDEFIDLMQQGVFE